MLVFGKIIVAKTFNSNSGFKLFCRYNFTTDEHTTFTYRYFLSIL